MKFKRAFAVFSALLMMNASVPFGIAGLIRNPLQPRRAPYIRPKKVKLPASHVLSVSQQKKIVGRAGQCPYLAGQNKWDVIYKGVDMMTGNYSTSATDLDFEGGYGIPVNVTRSYSSNSLDEGPLGFGWTLSCDVRNTAGGLLKSPSAPVRAVPKAIRERPPTEIDPNAEMATGVHAQPTQAVVATDAGGHQETIQRDVDGVLTTPPWDNNVNNTQYQFVTFNGAVYQVVVSNQTITPDGTTYTYQSEGSYPNGTVPYNNPTATPYPANVLKVTSATDRQGNVTNYNYGANYVSFQKSDGVTSEHPLIKVSMPNGHQLSFTWSGNHISSVTDGCGRTVSYGYSGDLLTSVTDPAGLTTYYGYGSAAAGNEGTPDVASNLLTSTTNPQGLTTSISYIMQYVTVLPYSGQVEAPTVDAIYAPNGSTTIFGPESGGSGNAAWEYMNTVPAGINPYNYTASEWYSVAIAAGYVNNGVMDVRTWLTSQDPSNVGFVDPTTFSVTSDKFYNIETQDLTEDSDYNFSYWLRQNDTSQYLYPLIPQYVGETDTVTSYNFAGNPLSQTVTESTTANSVKNVTSTKETDYAYWDQSKYWQQKAVRQTTDGGCRYSYTDYYPNTAAAGSRGQTYQVYDNAHGAFSLNTQITPPAWASTGDYWKYQITPNGGYSAQFAYDSDGRCTDVYKLQSTSTSPWTYVHTQTLYGANNDGSWGEASQVTEDQGGINRIKKTLGYTSDGKADEVQDAAGHIFQTNYDADGKILSVIRIDSGLSENLVNYTYGGAGITNGQPISITDGLSGITETLGYYNSGPGLGQVQSVTENDPGGTYSDTYTYDSSGSRTEATYTTPNGSTTWGYYDYISVGQFPKVNRVFQKMARLDSNGNPTAEEYDYLYNSAGQVEQACFAQTPEPGFTPSTGQTYYDGTHPASSRMRAIYTYDGAGRTTDLTYYQDDWNGNSFTSTPIYENSCAYDPDLGLKTSSMNSWQGGNTWTETYGYDPNFDYLTSANYGDGLPNAIQNWSYDAAGNRTDSVCDNLNRPITINGVSCTSDILGNRLTTGSTSMTWDCLNRMTTLTNTSGTWDYLYRADGMRVSKTNGSSTTLYRYDGQMSMEDVDLGTNPAITDYAIGARGIDAISKTSGGNTVVVYPIYDAHGNMMADVSRNGSGGFNVNDKRSYDAWGNVRSGATSGDPKGRYCANLGHVQDDESGLIYMRARYYEPTSGRFISEDPKRQSCNWFAYCQSSPPNAEDSSGKDFDPNQAAGCFIIGLLQWMAQSALGFDGSGSALVALGMQSLLAGWSTFAVVQGAVGACGIRIGAGFVSSYMRFIGDYEKMLTSITNNASFGLLNAESEDIANTAVDATAAEAGQIEAELFLDDIDSGD